MRNMKILIIVIIAILCFVGCAVLPTSKEYSYTITGVEGITDEQVKEIKSKIDKVYKYFDDKGYELDEVKFIIANNTRIDHPKNEIIIDFENIIDFELMQIILQHEFSDYLNYGLMYGVIHDIAKTYDLKFEEVNNYSIEEIEEYWDYMFLSYINFTPEIASESEVEIAKYVATELVNYILDKYGGEYLFDLMKKSSESVHANKVSEVLDEWIENNGGDFKDIRIVNREVFNQNPKDNTIAFSTENIYWVLYLNNKELLSDHYPNIHDDTKTFYDYMNIFYEEISRLEEVLEFDSSKLPTITVEVYNGIYNDTGDRLVGKYEKYSRKISLDTASSFSHEFVHFVDDCFNRKFKYTAYDEMRAVYYSRNFQLDYFLNYWYKAAIENIQKNELILIDPLAEVEKYLGRKLNQDDYHLLFNDLLIHTFIESGEEIPQLFYVSGWTYPTIYWISLFNFIDRTYGEEAVDTIMFEEKLPDGTMKNMTDTIEEWKIYITNLTKDDYGNYYD
ncbi:hypothetical protein [Proteiniborus sp. MB09-C3]|uniref:hypothetical protein n=1 Tax=Proteiniborus sp. MB09-C3 TaxID=3050072 RepID=UPI002556EB38|nr:hypothetical protein [Proteiniborus sp. MB09-C3]WIV11827.1 hypothetical protein QO263_17245 [Proteiniborus sp. MB09-C3]